MAVDADDLKLDFRPADFGDDDATFRKRLESVIERAEELEKQGRTDAQQEQYARALLIKAQIRELLRKTEEFTAVGEVSIKQGIEARVSALKREEAACLAAAGLSASQARRRSGSVSVPLSTVF